MLYVLVKVNKYGGVEKIYGTFNTPQEANQYARETLYLERGSFDLDYEVHPLNNR